MPFKELIFPYSVHRSTRQLSQNNQVHSFKPYLIEIHFNFPDTFGSHMVTSLGVFIQCHVPALQRFPLIHVCPFFTVRDWFILTIFLERYKLLSSLPGS